VQDEKWMTDLAERAIAAGMSGEEVKAAILEGVSEAHRVANAPPAPEPKAPEQQTDGLDLDRADADRLAAAHEASRLAQARRTRAQEARELLVAEGQLSAKDAAEIDDDTALQYSGVEPTERMIREAEERRILADPAASEQHYRERRKQELLASWDFLDPTTRDRDARELGIVPAQINANRLAKAKEGDWNPDVD
jgi:hypothetical protein